MDLQGKRLTCGQYCCWLLCPPPVTIFEFSRAGKLIKRHRLRGPEFFPAACGGRLWGPLHAAALHHRLRDVKRAFAQSQDTARAVGQTKIYTQFYLLDDAAVDVEISSASLPARETRAEAPDETLLFHLMLPGPAVRFRTLACVVHEVKPCTLTIQTVTGEQHTC